MMGMGDISKALEGLEETKLAMGDMHRVLVEVKGLLAESNANDVLKMTLLDQNNEIQMLILEQLIALNNSNLVAGGPTA